MADVTASQYSNADSAPAPSHRRQRNNESRRVQRWYRANKGRYICNILQKKSPYCKISPSILQRHFDVPAMPLSDNTPHWLNQLNPPPVNSDELTPPVSPSEVELQLKRLPWQSAPGQDRLPYSLWKSTPSSASVLGPIFSTCLANAKIPASWKTSTTILIYKKGDESSPDNWTTILIYKKGDESSPDNWRPISLQNTLYKIYAAILSSKDDIVRSLSAFSTFSSWSGLRLNVNKCGCFSFIQQQLQRTL